MDSLINRGRTFHNLGAANTERPVHEELPWAEHSDN